MSKIFNETLLGKWEWRFATQETRMCRDILISKSMEIGGS